MEWSKEEIMKLIEEYRKNECLWNSTIKEYKDKQKKMTLGGIFHVFSIASGRKSKKK